MLLDDMDTTNISPIDPHSVLRPLLLCLAAAAASKRAPPALIPLLTPINKQRVKLLVSDEDSTWLQLLSSRAADQWDRLVEIVGRDAYEPHPVSGEVELTFVANPQYYRLDEETLKAKLTVPDLEITVIYLWCDDSDPGPERVPNKWRVHEILPGTNTDKDPRWEPTLERAEEIYQGKKEVQRSPTESPFGSFTQSAVASTNGNGNGEDEEDDSYWNQYDKTPPEPAAKQSSPPKMSSIGRSKIPVSSNSRTSPNKMVENAERQSKGEEAYFERYNDVQPALDKDDEPEDVNDSPKYEAPDVRQILYSGAAVASAVRDAKLGPLTVVNRSPGEVDESDDEVTEPQTSLTTTDQTSVEGLGNAAVQQSNSQFAFRQHVGSNIRSLFNLSRTMGIERVEFEQLISTEVASLSMYDQEYV